VCVDVKFVYYKAENSQGCRVYNCLLTNNILHINRRYAFDLCLYQIHPSDSNWSVVVVNKPKAKHRFHAGYKIYINKCCILLSEDLLHTPYQNPKLNVDSRSHPRRSRSSMLLSLFVRNRTVVGGGH
jgi:hypothetical protein